MEDQRADALRRLEEDYIRGALDAEQYLELRKRVLEGEPTAAAQQPPYWPPPPGAAPAPPLAQYAPYAGMAGLDPVSGQRLASWGRRAAALLLDAFFFVVALVPTIVWAAATDDPVTGDLDAAPAIILALQVFLLPTLYHWLALGRWGQTLGKKMVGIAVRQGENGMRIGYARALGRIASALFLSLCTLPLLISYLWPLWDGRKQTLHDKMANTIVVRAV